MTHTHRSLSRRACLAGLGSLLFTGEVAAQAPLPTKDTTPAPKPKRALVGGTLLRPDAEPLADSVIVFEGDTISYVGADRGPIAGAPVTSIEGGTVTAGFVDLLTHVGVEEVSLEPSTLDTAHASDDPVRAAFRTADGYDPASTLIPICRRGGLTSVGVVPGPIPLSHGNTFGLVSGQSAWADLTGEAPAEALARSSLALHVHMHDGAFGDAAHTRGTMLLRLRELFDDTRAYVKNKAAYDKAALRKLGPSRLDLEVVARALAGELPTVVHVDRASDIATVLDLGAANGLRLVLASCAEGWKVRKLLAKRNVPVIVYPLDEGPRSFAARHATEGNAALLHAAGVSVAISTGESHNARKLAQAAGNAVRAGLPHRAALDAVTRAPARMLAMSAYGEVAPKQIANLVVWSGDPFELSSRPVSMFIRGQPVSLRSRQTALFERYR